MTMNRPYVKLCHYHPITCIPVLCINILNIPVGNVPFWLLKRPFWKTWTKKPFSYFLFLCVYWICWQQKAKNPAKRWIIGCLLSYISFIAFWGKTRYIIMSKHGLFTLDYSSIYKQCKLSLNKMIWQILIPYVLTKCITKSMFDMILWEIFQNHI